MACAELVYYFSFHCSLREIKSDSLSQRRIFWIIGGSLVVILDLSVVEYKTHAVSLAYSIVSLFVMVCCLLIFSTSLAIDYFYLISFMVIPAEKKISLSLACYRKYPECSLDFLSWLCVWMSINHSPGREMCWFV